jgi:hypothetical protein
MRVHFMSSAVTLRGAGRYRKSIVGFEDSEFEEGKVVASEIENTI